MAIRDIWSRLGRRRVKGVDISAKTDTSAVVQEDIREDEAAADGAGSEPVNPSAGVELVARTSGGKAAMVKEDQSGAGMNEAFGKLIEQLRGINEHLGRQVDQHAELMGRMDRLPSLLENFPAAAEKQKEMIEALGEQLKNKELKEQQFVETIEQIPAQTAKQTDALVEMQRRLGVVAEIDAKMSEGFVKFNEVLGQLEEDTVSQTGSIVQMNETFTAGDRYLKSELLGQKRRFMWMFAIAMGVCTLAIGGLVAVILIRGW